MEPIVIFWSFNYLPLPFQALIFHLLLLLFWYRFFFPHLRSWFNPATTFCVLTLQEKAFMFFFIILLLSEAAAREQALPNLLLPPPFTTGNTSQIYLPQALDNHILHSKDLCWIFCKLFCFIRCTNFSILSGWNDVKANLLGGQILVMVPVLL